jgi:DMSO/TMAO reductase YedYZ molybdopterin-dependent catalytic subunit
VLTAGRTPRISGEEWTLKIDGMVAEPHEWSGQAFGELPVETVPCDIHCVTKWSKLDTSFGGVSLDVLLDEVEPLGGYAMAYSYGGYTTNVPLEDLTDGKAWVVTEHEGAPLPREHGGPARLLVPHLYFWKSAKWLAGLRIMDHDEPGFWESNGYHMRGDPWKEERYWTD